ncbi:hypothetical protein GCM10027405_10490 [Arthrobacter alkaliphilus]|uniref:DUF4229 domain-containing protein n=1 Tax=Arthrobacter alkaliphilus TaxID=369936 RepID=UPI001F203D9B|nr:DUF4229 domain-containing protein [Arthrobacter alkaliphilus]
MAFLKYSLIRLAIFLPLFVLFALLQTGLVLAAIFAGLIAFAISYLFFQKQRDAATAAMRERFSGRAKPIRSALEIEDASIEDRMVDENPTVRVENDRRPKES